MGQIIQFPVNDLETQVNSGEINDQVRVAMRKILPVLQVNNPDSWDLRFITDLLITPYRQLSSKQIVQLERILGDQIHAEKIKRNPDYYKDFF